MALVKPLPTAAEIEAEAAELARLQERGRLLERKFIARRVDLLLQRTGLRVTRGG